MSKTWVLFAINNNDNYVAYTDIDSDQLVYRALSKWLIRGEAGNAMSEFWEYIDRNDNILERSLLDQLLSQAENEPEDPQTTNVKTKNYSIDMTVHSQSSSETYKSCLVEFTVYVYFESLKKNVKLDTVVFDTTMIQLNSKIEHITVTGPTKTPFRPVVNSKRVQKRSSKKDIE